MKTPQAASNGLQVLPAGRAFLAEFEPGKIEASGNPTLAVDQKFQIILVNPAYYEFARNNDGDEIAARFGPGANMLDGISGQLKEHYRDLFAEVMAKRKWVTETYECSSPELFREYRMDLYPLKDGEGVLAEHCLIVAQPHSRQATESPLDEYIDEHGILHSCSHCRRIRHLKTERWDWSPEAMSFKQASHTLCPACLVHYYPMT